MEPWPPKGMPWRTLTRDRQSLSPVSFSPVYLDRGERRRWRKLDGRIFGAQVTVNRLQLSISDRHFLIFRGISKTRLHTILVVAGQNRSQSVSRTKRSCGTGVACTGSEISQWTYHYTVGDCIHRVHLQFNAPRVRSPLSIRHVDVPRFSQFSQVFPPPSLIHKHRDTYISNSQRSSRICSEFLLRYYRRGQTLCSIRFHRIERDLELQMNRSISYYVVPPALLSATQFPCACSLPCTRVSRPSSFVSEK